MIDLWTVLPFLIEKSEKFILFLGDVLLFLKRYDPKTKSISYCGHVYMPITDQLCKYAIEIRFVLENKRV